MTTRAEAKAVMNEIETALKAIRAEERWTKMKEIEPLISGIKCKIDRLDARAAGCASILRPDASTIVTSLNGVQSLVTSLAGGSTPAYVTALDQKIQAKVSELSQISMPQPNFSQVAPAMAAINGSVQGVLNQLVAERKNLETVLRTLGKGIADATGDFKDSVEKAVDSARDKLAEAIGESLELSFDGFSKVDEALANFETNAKDVVSELKEEFEGLASLFGELNEALPQAQGGVGVAKAAIEETKAVIEETLAIA